MTKRYFLIPIIFFIVPFAACAQETKLGDFSVNDVQKMTNGPISFHFADQKFAVEKNSLLDWLKVRPSLNFENDYDSEAENINFYPSSKPELAVYYRFLIRSRDRYHTKIFTSISINEESLKRYLEDSKEKTRVNPENARLAFAEGKVSAFSLSKNGLEIDSGKSVEKVVNQLKQNPYLTDISLESAALKPEVASSDLDKYGIKELIGEGTSNFRGSPKNRIHNINVGASKFNGVLVKPGEEFSFIKTLGPVDKSTGYLPELVIKVDKTIPEYGGGMCQVSTTMFRAALNAGLKITARTNHAYPVQYYAPHGLDATVYIPNPDMKFKNDTPNYILVQTRIEGTQLFFDFYGTSDGRQTKIIGPTVTQKNPDGSMKAIAYQEVYDANGNLLRKDTFKSNYDSPNKYPHPGEKKITEKPEDWSSKQWKEYKKANGL